MPQEILIELGDALQPDTLEAFIRLDSEKNRISEQLREERNYDRKMQTRAR